MTFTEYVSTLSGAVHPRLIIKTRTGDEEHEIRVAFVAEVVRPDAG